MVLSSFEGIWVFSHLQSSWPTTAVPGKYQWGVCHCLWVNECPRTWSPSTTLSLYYNLLLKGPQALSHCCSHHNKVHPWQQYRPLQVRPLIQTVQKWNLPVERFSKSRVHTRCHQQGQGGKGSSYFFLYISKYVFIPCLDLANYAPGDTQVLIQVSTTLSQEIHPLMPK